MKTINFFAQVAALLAGPLLTGGALARADEARQVGDHLADDRQAARAESKRPERARRRDEEPLATRGAARVLICTRHARGRRERTGGPEHEWILAAYVRSQ